VISLRKMPDAKIFVPDFYVDYISKILYSTLIRFCGRQTPDTQCT
jgi:hypothetical protein